MPMRVVGLLALSLTLGCTATVRDHGTTPGSDEAQVLHSGDIVFQVSESKQCEAVRAATGSVYAHCGMVHFVEGEPYVLEAVQPVRSIPLKEWEKHGRNGHYVVKRLRDTSALTSSVLDTMQAIGSRMLGLDYDPYFMWSDRDIYCSELVWKIYERGAGITLCALRPMRTFDLSAPMVREVMEARYGDRIPLDEPMVSPGDLFDGPLLVEVFRKGEP